MLEREIHLFFRLAHVVRLERDEREIETRATRSAPFVRKIFDGLMSR